MSSTTVQVVVLGNVGVGKTSLILAAAQSVWKQELVKALPPTTFQVPLELLGGPPCTCVAYDIASIDDPEVLDIIRNADVALVCFSMQDAESIRAALDYWVLQAERTRPGIPILLVGCKSDLCTHDNAAVEAQHARIEDYLSAHSSIVRTCECTSREAATAQLIFALACDAYLHPVAPIYNHVSQRLHHKAIRAFNRVFRIVDEAGQGALSKENLRKLHTFCFGGYWDDLEETLQTLMDSLEGSVTTAGMAPVGFLQLQCIAIKRECMYQVWRMLTQFGYDKQLELKLPNAAACPPTQQEAPGTITQLSEEAVAFLVSDFQKRCAGRGSLPMSYLLGADAGANSVFRYAPAWGGRRHSKHEHPLDVATVSSIIVARTPDNSVQLSSYLCIWAYCTLVNPQRAVLALLYMGFCDTYGRFAPQEGPRAPPGPAVGSTAVARLLVSSPRRENSVPVERPPAGVRIYNCLLFGSRGAGKTTLLRSMAGASGDGDAAEAGSDAKAACLLPEDTPPQMLLLVEVASSDATPLAINARSSATRERLLGSDLLLFGFNATAMDSYIEARDLLVALSDATGNKAGVMLVALKSDLGISAEIQRQLDQDCNELGIKWEHGLRPACPRPDALDWTKRIIAKAASPSIHIARTPALIARQERDEWRGRMLKWSLLAAATVGVIAYVGWMMTSRNDDGDGRKSDEDSPSGKSPSKASSSASTSTRNAPGGTSNTAKSDTGWNFWGAISDSKQTGDSSTHDNGAATKENGRR